MKIDPGEFRVEAGEKVRLDKRPTRVGPYYKSKVHYEALLDEHISELSVRTAPSST